MESKDSLDKSTRANKIFKLICVVITILAIVFLIGAIFSFSYDRKASYFEILKYGIEVEAEVVTDSMEPSFIDDFETYSVEYIFKDSDGNIHKGRTTKTYYFDEIVEIINNGKISIKYLPDTYESIESSAPDFYYNSEENTEDFYIASWIVWAVIDIIFWVILGFLNVFRKKICSFMLLVMSDSKPKQSLKVKQCIYCDTLCDLKDVKCCNCGSHKFRKYNKGKRNEK